MYKRDRRLGFALGQLVVGRKTLLLERGRPNQLIIEDLSMSHVLEFDSQERILRVTVQGELTDAGASDLYGTVHSFLSSHEVRGGILDLSPVTSLSVKLDTVRRLAKDPPLFKTSQLRVIVAPGDLVFGMARLFQISRSEIHSELYVVHTLEEAYKIHGLKSPHFTVVNARAADGREE